MEQRMHPGVHGAIQRERAYQDTKWGNIQEKPHDVPGWLLIMRKELEEAEAAWMKGSDADAMRELLQVVAVGVAAMEQHGAHERKIPLPPRPRAAKAKGGKRA